MNSKEKRLLGFRKQEDASLIALHYPFGYLRSGEYILADIITPLAMQQDIDVGDFPSNVAEVVWAHEGVKDEEPWYAFARLTSGLYVYYTAWCDYTGFDCRGGMKLYCSRNRATLIQFAMEERAYQQYLKETVWFKNIPAFKSELDDVFLTEEVSVS